MTTQCNRRGIDTPSGLRDSIVAYAHDHLPECEGTPAYEMPATRHRNGHQVKSDYADSVGGITIHHLTLSHPELGDYAATVDVIDGEPVAAAWAYGGEQCEVNGVLYSTRRKAVAVRATLSDAGIGHHYPGTREATKALREAGVI